ncbi:hypothetical protein [Treponema bryantii]|uniref:helix-turn-helix transcriptional regulator n=1 Tax=Treponema bryantii TaxID=163 RepID=UPI002B30AB1C|nr:hypothetical protein TRBR_07570 [Treponema bryantii]
MNSNRISSERVVAVVGLFFLLIAAITSLFFNGDPKSIIEKVADTNIVIPVVHFLCVGLTIIHIIRPNSYLMLAILLIESELTILTHYEELGIFFFYAAVIFMLCTDFLAEKSKKPIWILFVIHFITLCLTYTHGIKAMLIDIGYSVFCYSFYLWIYSILKAKFSCLIPKNVRENNTIIGKPAGSVIKLSDYNLNERQRTYLMEHIHNKLSYKEIGEKYFVSLSTVKKIFADIFKIFNVSNIEELRLLLLQYQVEE